MATSPDTATIITWITKGIGGITTMIDGLSQYPLPLSQGQADQLSQSAVELSTAVERFITLSLE